MNATKENDKEKKQKKEQEKCCCSSSPHPPRRGDFESAGVKIAAYSLPWNRGITTNAVREKAALIGMSPDEAADWLKHMEIANWCFSDEQPVTGRNFGRSMRGWHRIQRKIILAKASREARRAAALERKGESAARRNAYEVQRRREALRRVEMALKPESWELCGERCAMFLRGKCSKGRKIPPQLRERPVAPEECGQFKAKEVR